ncbi:MAG: DUF711 family protein, partial [Clostridia bacterium]|nr:DUF711 family protein [Clostridia bacterium]
MINTKDILETINMIDNENLDVRTITMGISLLSCADSDADRAAAKVYEKITRTAEKLVETGEFIEKTYGIPIINKRISVTPAAMLAASSGEPVKYARVMDRAARELGVNFIGGYSALVQKGFSAGDRELIESIPEALSVTDFLCSSVNVGSTRAGINLAAVRLLGVAVTHTAAATADNGG